MRTVDVEHDDAACVPGFEYHYLDEFEDPPQWHSQIPEGFAGAPNHVDDRRADASRWTHALPLVRQFRALLRGTKL